MEKETERNEDIEFCSHGVDVRRDKWCEYCGFGSGKGYAENWTVCKQNREEEVVIIKFCPMCGRKLRT